MLSPAQQNISIVRGDDRDFLISFFDTESDAPIPLVDIADVWFTMRESWAGNDIDDAEAIFQVSLLGGGITTEGAYSVRLALPHTQTVLWTFNEYVHDVQISTVTGKLTTTQRGLVRVLGD